MILQTLPARSGWKLFRIEGQLDFASGPMVQMALGHVADEGSGNVLIDLEDVKTADEPGIASLAAGVRQLQARNPRARIAFVARSRWLADALSRTRETANLDVFRHGADALAKLAA